MRQTVSVGSKLRKKDAPAYVLEIVELLARNDGFPHARARVMVTNTDLGVRLYSISALVDPSLFEPVAAKPQQVEFR